MLGAGHLKQRRTSRVRGIVLGLSLASATGAGVPFATGAQIPPPPVETAPAFQPPVLLPSLGDFVTGKPLATCCKLMATDCLLRPPFAGAPVTDPKGLASKIRAKELDAKNRIIALQYLGTVDCVKFPEAKTMLVEELHNDPFEPVRYQAALSLGVMMGRGNTRRDMRTLRRGRAVRYDTCIGCCNEKVLKALAKTAYEMDDHGCCFEPSKRVREAALEAIHACGCEDICMQYAQQPPMPVPQGVAPPAPAPAVEPPPAKPKEVAPPRPMEVTPPPPGQNPKPKSSAGTESPSDEAPAAQSVAPNLTTSLRTAGDNTQFPPFPASTAIASWR